MRHTTAALRTRRNFIGKSGSGEEKSITMVPVNTESKTWIVSHEAIYRGKPQSLMEFSMDSSSKDESLMDNSRDSNGSLRDSDGILLDSNRNFLDNRRNPTPTFDRRKTLSDFKMSSFQFERNQVRIEGLQEYALINALIVSIVFAVISYTYPGMQFSSVREMSSSMQVCVDTLISVSFVIFSSLCVIYGMFSTIAFTLVGLYAKTAVGLCRDSSCQDFLTATASSRFDAFNAFLISTRTFNVSFVLSLHLNFNPGIFRWIVLIVSSSVSIRLWWDIQGIIDLASNHIYSKRD